MEKKVVALHTSGALVERLRKLWAEMNIPAKLINIIDDSLIWEVIENGSPTVEVQKRMLSYAQAAEVLKADFIFNTCSSVGGVASMMRNFVTVPIIKIDEPMAATAVESGQRIGVLATLPSTVNPTKSLIAETAESGGKKADIIGRIAEGAFSYYMKGDLETHNSMIREEALSLSKEVDLIVLAQGSMSLMEEELSEITGVQVLSSPVSGVRQFLDIIQS